MLPHCTTGPQGTKKYASAIEAAVPDRKIEHHDVLSKGDKVLVRWTNSGTNMGPLFCIIAYYLDAIANMSLIWSRFRISDYNRPFMSPVKIGRFPVLAGMGLIASIGTLFQFNIDMIVGGFLAFLSIMVLCIVLIKLIGKMLLNKQNLLSSISRNVVT